MQSWERVGQRYPRILGSQTLTGTNSGTWNSCHSVWVGEPSRIGLLGMDNQPRNVLHSDQGRPVNGGGLTRELQVQRAEEVRKQGAASRAPPPLHALRTAHPCSCLG